MARCHIVQGFLAFCILLAAGAAQAQSARAIADDAALRVALSEDLSGQVLVLAPGDYGPVELYGEGLPAGIRSADPEDPALIRGLAATGFDGLRLENLVLSYRFSPEDDIRIRPFMFRDCRGLEFVGNRVTGDRARGLGTAADGYGYGIGLTVRNCRDVRIEGNHISLFHRGMSTRETDNMTVVGNEVTQVRSDGMNFAQVSDLRIEGNFIHDFDRAPDTGDHADMIQFWTASTRAPSSNIVIRGNVLMSGAGLFTQSIFMRNELVDTGRAGPEMFYRNILIEENVIINAQLHGITVGESEGVMIRRNTLAQNPLSAGGDDPARNLRNPMIRVATGSERVRIYENVTFAIRGFENQPGWELRGNVEIQNQSLLRPGHYNQVFVGWPGGDPRALQSFFYRPDGMLADREAGAALLRQASP